MAVACASRFAVLKLEDDDLEIANPKSNQSCSQTGKIKATVTKSAAAAATETKAKPKKKKKGSNDVAELQSLAFGGGTTKTKKGGNQANAAPRNVNPKQWEEWKKKDDEFVSEAYEQDLHQALLLSKIDYEEKKEIYDAIQKETEQHGKLSSHAQKKKKKSNQKKEKSSMSLDEFQSLLPTQIDSGNYGRGKMNTIEEVNSPEKSVPVDESDFFHKIEEDAERIIIKEQRQEMFKVKPEVPVSDARTLRHQKELGKKDEEILLLNEDVVKLKEELEELKSVNKKLSSLLAEAERKEKAEILNEIQELNMVKDELTDQLNEYHVALEQERSKVHALQTELKKCHANRKDRRDSK